MDIRTTWSSNNISVDLSTIPPVIGPYPSNEEEFDEYQAAAAEVFYSFANLSSPLGIIDHAGTREVVQDYERIRIALGYERIHFLGAS
ncbi:hypothetical protein LTR86_008580 [Recurvomyces mirabilis]|nr:hypothetical protein LTR86_008580 [Recurvomyces mirabilis]